MKYSMKHYIGPLKKVRKKRTTGYNLCGFCYAYNCDPMSMSKKFTAKIDKRRRLNVCVSCGNNPCKCKSNQWSNIKES